MYKGEYAVLDGQNRLQAIIRSAEAQNTWVALNVPEEAFKYVDQGATRTLSHVMDAAGYPDSGLLSGTALMLYKHTQGLSPVSMQASQLSSGSLFDWLEQNHTDLKNFWLSHERLVKKAAKNAHLPASGLLFLYYLWCDNDTPMATEFLAYLSDPFESSAPAKLVFSLMKRLDSLHMECMSRKAEGKAMRTDQEKSHKMRLLQFGWLALTQRLPNRITSDIGFNKVFNKWLRSVADNEPWRIV